MRFKDRKNTFRRSLRSVRIDKPYITTLAMKISQGPLMRCDLRTVTHSLQTVYPCCRSVRSVRIDTWLIRTVTVRVYWTKPHLEDREVTANRTSEPQYIRIRCRWITFRIRIQPACTSESTDSCGKRTRNKSPKKRYTKKPRNSSEMLEFLKQYSEQREKVEEEKL